MVVKNQPGEWDMGGVMMRLKMRLNVMMGRMKKLN